jgi:hypothetical protein
LGNIVRAKLDDADLPGLIEASFNAVESEIEKRAQSYFGDEITREIIFSVSTLKSAYRWLPHLGTSPEPDGHETEDRELCQQFGLAATWSHFQASVKSRTFDNQCAQSYGKSHRAQRSPQIH